MDKSSIRGTYFWIVLSFGLLILLVVFAYYSFIMNFTEKTTLENLNFATDLILYNIAKDFTNMENISDSLVNNKHLHEFLRQTETRDIYLKGITVGEIVERASYKSQIFDSLIIFHEEGSYYRYLNHIENSECEMLFKKYGDNPKDIIYAIDYVDENAMFLMSRPVYSITNNRVEYLGSIVLLSNAQKNRDLINSFNQYSNLAICLVDQGDTILLSSVREEEGISLNKSTLFSDENSYTKVLKPANTRLKVVTALPKETLYPHKPIFFISVSIVILAIATLIFLSTYLTNRRIIRPITELIDSVKTLPGESAHGLIPVKGANKDIKLLAHNINQLLVRVEESNIKTLEAQEDLYNTELIKQQMQLYILRKQINTHFAFNSLNAITALAREDDNDDILHISDALATLMRYSYSIEDFINIFEEMEIIEKYLNVMNIRFKDKFKVDFDVDDRLCECIMLRQLLQPIVENAIIHGCEANSCQGELYVSGDMIEGALIFKVRDNGVGIDDDLMARIQGKLAEEDHDYSLSGISIINIHKRIKLFHGDEYGLRIESKKGEGTIVTLRLPIIYDI